MRRLLLAALALMFVAALGGLYLLSPVERGGGRDVPFEVLPGESLRTVAHRLDRARVIRNPDAFVLLARVHRADGRIQAGPYRARTDEWAWTVLGRLRRGAVEETTFTVPEGLWLSEVAAIAGPLVAGGADSFLTVASDSTTASALGIPGPTVEGFLFPSTYRTVAGTSPESVIRLMTGTFDRLWDSEFAARAESLGVDEKTVVTLASIVEAEAQSAAERPRIASVYWNRIREGMPLQADPTVVYGLGSRRRRVLLDDLNSPSPYNTYRVAGLPPGPIGNPGRDAIRAVLWPDPACRDMYFVARGDGTHLFARTYQEHLENRRLVRAGAPE